jgi:hypothetical protein
LKKIRCGRWAIVDFGRRRTTYKCPQWLDYGEAAMKYSDEKNRDALLPDEGLHTPGNLGAQLPTANLQLTVERHPPQSKSESACRDYSEDAIPERDPAFRLPGATDYYQLTVEALSEAMRLDLACRLQQLGMSRARAALMARL